MNKLLFLQTYVAAALETVAARPKHSDIESAVRRAFDRSRLTLQASDTVTVAVKPSTGMVVVVSTNTRRHLRYKQMLRLRAYLMQDFDVRDVTVGSTLIKGRAVVQYRIIIRRVKVRAKDKQ